MSSWQTIDPAETLPLATSHSATDSSRDSPAPWWERAPIRLGRLAAWWSRAARGVHRVDRLLLLRRRAIDAEARGALGRADFFWLEVHCEVERLADHPEVWMAFARRQDASISNASSESPDRLLQGFARGALIDTHYAYFRAWQPTSPERAFIHLAHVRRLAPLAGLTADETRIYTGPTTLEEVEFRCQRREWSKALSLAIDLTRRYQAVPVYHATLADVQTQATLAALRGSPTRRVRRHDARALAAGLHALKTLRLERPHDVATFVAIARLHVTRAETLAADGLLAEALVEAEAAVIYWPQVAGGTDLRARLEAEMQQLRVQAATQVDTAPRRDRDAEQRYRQTAKGFRLLDAFRRSDEVRAVTDDLVIAQARTVWETAGLPPLDPIDHRPLALDDALQTIRGAPPTDPADLVSCWHRTARDNPHLRELTASGVISYLSHELFGTPFVQALPDVPPATVAGVPPPVGAPIASNPPFMFWAFSSRNRLLKVQLVAAVGLAVLAAILGVGELQGRRVRNAAYISLQSAREQAAPEPMLDAAEQFLAVRLFADDPRIAEVEALYSEALVRWFSETAPPPEIADRRIRRYGELLSVGESQDR